MDRVGRVEALPKGPFFGHELQEQKVPFILGHIHGAIQVLLESKLPHVLGKGICFFPLLLSISTGTKKDDFGGVFISTMLQC